MSNLVTIFGGSGFLGRYIARRMAAQGRRVRVAVRRPNEAVFVRPYGAVGQVEPVFANVRDDASVAAAIDGADAVVNCVGTMDVGGRNCMDALHNEAADRIARLASQAEITRLVHVSALGADENGESCYAQSKAAGEAAILAHFPNAMILRPSAMFGTEDQFFNRFANMSRMGPILPLVGGDTRFQPVFVDDVAAAAEIGVTQGISGLFELGGPDVDTLSGWVKQMLGIINRRKLVVNKPFFAGHLIALSLDMVQAMTLGLFHNTILTRDQVKALKTDNVVSPDAKGFADLGLTPRSAQSVLPEYLWPFRPSGQFDAIKASAKNLKA